MSGQSKIREQAIEIAGLRGKLADEREADMRRRVTVETDSAAVLLLEEVGK